MTNYDINKLVELIENRLSQDKLLEIENMILENPEVLETIHELASLKRKIGKKTDLKKYLDNQKQTLFTKLNINTMSNRKVYHITKTKNGWQSKIEGGERASVTGDTKKEVVKKNIEIAKNQGNSSIKIHKKNGKFQEERTYPKKTDPYPPMG